MKEKKQKANKKNVILAIIKKIKPSTLIIAILLLMFNSYAWFIYATKVEVGFTAHVTSWNVEFDVGQGEESSTNIVIDLERIYPGMEDYEKESMHFNYSDSFCCRIYKSLLACQKTSGCNFLCSRG